MADTTKNTAAATYFASGSNRPAEIRGLARIGHAIGLAAPEVSPAAELELEQLAGTGVRVFIDSGAFSEVEFGAAGPVVVKPMTDNDWTKIFALYLRLARKLGSQLYIVAPDRVGSQRITLERLRRYAGALWQLRKLGANILVAMQKGPLSQAHFDIAVGRVLEFTDYVRAMPCNKKATTVEELASFVAARRPARIHLLGLGVRNRNFDAYAAAATAHGAELFCDSNMLKASVGRTNGRKNMASEELGGRRVYTRAQDLAREIIAEELTRFECPRELGIVLAFSTITDEAARWAIVERKLEARRAARVAVA